MKKRFFIACLFSTIISLVFAQVCFAKERQLGYVSSRTGDVKVRRAKKTVWTPVELSMPVYFGDHIRTWENSRVTITLVDRSSLEIHSNTHIALNTIVSPVEKKNSVLLFFGRIWNKVRKTIVQMKGYEVQTPTAVLGVRGTEFDIASYEDGTMIIRVDSGKVTVDSETDQRTLCSNQGTQLSFDAKKIVVEPDYRPEWERAEKDARKNLFADGKKYGGFVYTQIHRQTDYLKGLVDKVNTLTAERERYVLMAKEARKRGDEIGYESSMSEVKKISREILELNKRIAFNGRRLECDFGLFSHYGYLAKHPELSKKFHGKEFILKQLDNIEMIHAEFNAMIEEGMKLSMKDMEDLMDEMKGKVEEFRESREKKDPFEELDKD
ncbi:MAG: FecR domain-containing protein [Deltaproteobacteria bacterium]|nr:FecR domain-containing protein [Deltaproteobacteria bacterium]MBW2339224.1 FecR domain-containing protein [Deltaproteobacteria bacterium]